MSVWKKICFWLLGMFGVTCLATGINGLGLYLRLWGPEMLQYLSREQLGEVVAWTAVGAFLLWLSIKELRKKRPKVFAKLIKSNGDKPSFVGPFKNMKALNFWYQAREEWEGVENVEIVKS